MTTDLVGRRSDPSRPRSTNVGPPQPETRPPTTRQPETRPPTTRQPETRPPTTRQPGARRTGDPLPELFRAMSAGHGVIDSRTARRLGLTRATERTLLARGVLTSPAVGVLAATAAPTTWEQRARTAVLSPGAAVLSHGAAARLHQLDGFQRYEPIDVICRKGSWPRPPAGTITHHTRGLTDDDITEVRSIPTLTVAATLSLLAPMAGRRSTERALDSALRSGATIEELIEVAVRWRRRGRPGPAQLLQLLDEREPRACHLAPVRHDRLA